MNTKKRKSSRKLFRTLSLILTVLFLLGLASPSMGTDAVDLAQVTQQESQMVMARAQGSTGEDVPLAGAEAWALASVDISGAPDGAVVSTVRAKYHVVYSEPGELEVQLQAMGSEVSHTLWDRQSVEGSTLAQNTEKLATFQDAPVNGTWSLAVQGGDAEGYIDSFSIVVYYEIEMPVLRMEGEGSPGTPGFLSLPEGATPALSPDRDPVSSVEGASVVPQDVPPGAIIIESNGFASGFPTGLWNPFDLSNDGRERFWDNANCDQCGGDWALWPADEGADGVDVCAGDNYPNNMQTWTTYGPFDLSDASNAGTEFVMWHEIEPEFDFVFFGYSGDGTNFTGWFFDNYYDCTRWNAYYPEAVGDSSVWVAWVFFSDSSVTYRGPWVDDVVIWKEHGGNIKIDPPVSEPSTGTSFSVDVIVEDAVNLGAFQFELTYDPSCITANDVALGPFLGSTGRTVYPVGPSYGAGSVAFGASSSGAASGPNGNGVLATVTFAAGSSECESALHLQNVIATDTAGNVQNVSLWDGLVLVNPCGNSTCPEDVNGDGVVNIQDIQLVASKWGWTCPTR
jgi:hypothetical protein